MAELRKVPAEKLGVNITRREKEEDAFMGRQFPLFTAWTYCYFSIIETVVYYDGDFFPESFDELRAKAKPKPMMTGVTKEEGLLMSEFHCVWHTFICIPVLSMKFNKKTASYFTTLASHSVKNNKLLEVRQTLFPSQFPFRKNFLIVSMDLLNIRINLESLLQMWGTSSNVRINLLYFSSFPIISSMLEHSNCVERLWSIRVGFHFILFCSMIIISQMSQSTSTHLNTGTPKWWDSWPKCSRTKVLSYNFLSFLIECQMWLIRAISIISSKSELSVISDLK